MTLWSRSSKLQDPLPQFIAIAMKGIRKGKKKKKTHTHNGGQIMTTATELIRYYSNLIFRPILLTDEFEFEMRLILPFYKKNSWKREWNQYRRD